jgi:hypothetical protein
LSSYLQIAEVVLREARRPMSARAILRLAYERRLVPSHLYGETQHKTLQARLSEDILHRRDHSVFFRTQPGQFFLREFLVDQSIPEEYRRPILARRRTRDLFLGPALAIEASKIKEWDVQKNSYNADLLREAASSGAFRYVDPKEHNSDSILVWSVAALVKPGKVLSYRLGKYRDDRDSFANKRSIAFSSLVSEENRTLFDHGGLGVADSAFFAIATDLDIPLVEAIGAEKSFNTKIKFLSLDEDTALTKSLLAFVEVSAPDWFEPAVSRLSLNDLNWIEFNKPPNNWSDFDPWSRILLQYYFPNEVVNG